MKSILRKIFILVIAIIFITTFSTSYSSLNLDQSAFVVALGIDSTESNTFKFTFQFINPPSTSEGSNQDSKIITNTVETDSITNAINIMNAYLAKKLNLSHCKMIVISEDVAKNGISKNIYSLMNDVQIRPSANIIISKSTAQSYINNSKPSLESLVTKYYDIFPYSSKYTGYVVNATMGNFLNNLSSNYSEPYAILGGISQKNNTSLNSSITANNSSNNENIKSGTNIISGNSNSENIGTAIFKEDKLIGELNAIETTCFSILNNKINNFLISIPDPTNKNSNLDIYLNPITNTKINVKIINNSPYIKINGKFTAQIQSMNQNSKYLNSDILNSISNNCNKYLESELSKYLYKTSLSFKSDINSIGKNALKNFKTLTEFNNYNWKQNYTNSIFDIKIETIMNSGFLLTET